MATNHIEIEFDPCEPTPIGGFKLSYRPQGSSEPYRVYPFPFFASPIQISVEGDPFGTSYEGFLQGDCGPGQLGVPVPWSGTNEEAPSGGGSGSGGGPSIPDCTAVTIAGGQPLADAYEGIPYSDVVNLSGSAPFNLTAITKPAWMTIIVVGSQVQLTGTPTAGSAGTGINVAFTARNCSNLSTANYSDTITVFAISGNIENLNTSPQRFQINSISGAPAFSYTVLTGSFPILNGQSMKLVHSGYAGNLSVNVTAPSPGGGTPNKKLQYVKNGVVVQSQNLFTPGSTVIFPGVSFIASDQIVLRIVPV